MGRAPLRFIHAANLHLDLPLNGIGPAPKPLQETIEQATLRAFDRLIEACLEHEVDFLLLTGECEPDAENLTEAAAFRDGVERLVEYEIPLILGPVSTRAGSRKLLVLPENVVRLDLEDLDPCVLTRAEAPLATLCPLLLEGRPDGIRMEPQLSRLLSESQRSDAPVIAVPLWPSMHEPLSPESLELLKDELNANGEFGLATYWAFGNGDRRFFLETDATCLHHPGALQGMHPAATGPHGYRLVRIDEDGLEVEHIAAAPVRWERFTLEIDPATDREHLLALISEELLNLEPAGGEEAWLCEWIIRGDGELFERLQEPEFAAELLAEFDLSAGESGWPVWSHRLRLRDSAARVARFADTEGLAGEYLRRLAEQGAAGEPAGREPQMLLKRLRTIVAEEDAEEIMQAARTWGGSCLAE